MIRAAALEFLEGVSVNTDNAEAFATWSRSSASMRNMRGYQTVIPCRGIASALREFHVDERYLLRHFRLHSVRRA
jgi:hypothetical protein